MNNASSSALAFAFLAGALVLVPGAAGAELPPAGASPTPISTAVSGTNILAVQQTVALGCSGSGSSDVASRKHSITNTAGHPIPKGTIVSWVASNKGSGKLTLSSDLAPNGTVDVIEPGQTNGYTCTASFVPGPVDLVLKSVKWINDTTAQVTVGNANPWRDAGASTLRVQRMKCLTTQLGATDMGTPAIPKGGYVVVNVPAAKAGADYLQASANATSTLQESTTANNVGKSPEFGSNKSCTPQ
ncbi:MAG: hypothetical protein JWP87_2743 [Labilithrix sp.]|nr:hypothetical protein [Labilithrix sp.]